MQKVAIVLGLLPATAIVWAVGRQIFVAKEDVSVAEGFYF